MTTHRLNCLSPPFLDLLSFPLLRLSPISVLVTLRAMFGADKVAPVLKAHVTRWGQDPFARGSYAVPSFPFMREFVSVLAADVEKKLFFAGEVPPSVHLPSLSSPSHPPS